MNVFAKFDEIPSMILQDIKETKRYGNTVGRSFGRTFGCENSIPSHKHSLRGYNKNIIMSSFKSSGGIHKKENGPDSCFG